MTPTEQTHSQHTIIVKWQKKMKKHASSPEVLNPVGDHSGRLEAAMGVYQCVLFLFFCDRGGTGRWAGIVEGGECLDRVHNNSGCSVETKGASFFLFFFIHNEVLSSSAPCSWKCFGMVRVEIKAFSPARGRMRLRGGEERGVTWVGTEGEEGAGRRRKRREVEGSPRHRMTAGESPKGEGPVYQLPCPHSPFNKPDLTSVCLSYIYIYIFIYR